MTVETQGVSEQVAIAPENTETFEGGETDKSVNISAMRESMGSMKRELDELRQRDGERQDQLNLYAANTLSQKQQPEQEVGNKYEPDDLMTHGEYAKGMREQQARFDASMSELQVRSKFDDFDEIVNKEAFSPLVKAHPELEDVVMSSKNPNLLAYLLGKGQKLSKAEKTANDVSKAKAQQIVNNAQLPGSSAGAVGGSGALSKADMFANMSRAEFLSHVEKVKRGG